MPRIPSAAEVNAVGAAASRLPRVRAESLDFGAATALALDALGGDLVVLRDNLEAAAQRTADQGPEEQDKALAQKEPEAPEQEGQALKEARLSLASGLVGIEKSKLELRARGHSLIDEMGPGSGASGRGAEETLKAFERSKKEVLSALSPEQQELAREAVAPVEQSLAVRTRRRDHNLKVEGLLEDTEEILQALTTLALREPEAAEDYVGEGEAVLRSLARIGGLTEDQAAAKAVLFRRSLYTALLRGQAAMDAVAALKAGAYDAALDDPALKAQMLMEATQRLEVEQAQGVAGTRWLVAQARKGATAPDLLRRRQQRILSAEDAGREEERIERVRRVRSELEALRYAPEARLRQGAADLPLASEVGDAKALVEIQEEFRLQAEDLLRQRREDPAGYVMGLPGIAEAFAAAEADPGLLPAAVAERLAAQAAMGLPPEMRNALTRSERRQLVTGLRRMAPEQRGAALIELREAYGDQAGAVLADLAEAGLTVAEALMADPSGSPELAEKLRQAAESRDEVSGPQGDSIREVAERLIGEVEGAEGPSAEPVEDLPGVGAEEQPLPLPKPILPFDQRVEMLGERPSLSVEEDLRFSLSFATAEEKAGPRAQWMVFSGNKSEQMEKQFALLKLQPLHEKLIEDYGLSDEEKEIAFDALQMVLGRREVPGSGEARGNAIHEYIAKELEKIVPPEAQARGVVALKMQWLGAFKNLTDFVDGNPLENPVLLSGDELLAGLGGLVEKLKKSGDSGLAFAFVDLMFDFVPGGKVLKKIGSIGLNLLGVIEAMDTEEASTYLLQILLEMKAREMLRVSVEANGL